MNTVVGFTCAVGIDMSFNTKHHDEEQSIENPIHIHSDGKKHIHQEPVKPASHTHSDGKKHIHQEPVKPALHTHADGKKHEHSNEAITHKHEEKKAPEKDGCCNNEVIKFQNVEKNLTPKTIIDVPGFVAILSTFPAVNLFNVVRSFPHKRIVRFFYPPPPDILISIQKFQV